LKKRASGKRKKRVRRGRLAGTGIVLLDPDVAQAFPDGKSVNRALRAIIAIAPKSRTRSK
jgi:hypothetical protein